jgi:hypothetical protein
MNSCVEERPLIQILLGGWSEAPAREQSSKTWRLNRSEADVNGLHYYISLNSSVLHFGSLKFDNSKGPHYSVLGNEVVIFCFWINKNSWRTVEVVLLIWSSGLASSVQFPVASVIAVNPGRSQVVYRARHISTKKESGTITLGVYRRDSIAAG